MLQPRNGLYKICYFNEAKFLVIEWCQFKSYSENASFLWKSSSLLLEIDQTNWVHGNDDQGMVYQNWPLLHGVIKLCYGVAILVIWRKCIFI